MSYLDRLLIPDEKIVHRARRSVFPTFAGPVLASVAAVAAAALLALLVPGAALVAWVLPLLPLGWLAVRWVWWTNKAYLVTTHRVLKLEGVFAKSHADASLDKINDMSLVQGLLGRPNSTRTARLNLDDEEGTTLQIQTLDLRLEQVQAPMRRPHRRLPIVLLQFDFHAKLHPVHQQ